MDRIRFDDVQGIILRGYKELPFARFLLLGVTDGRAARHWVGATKITSAAEKDHEAAVNIAFTWEGLRTLGVPLAELDQFAPELREGMSKSEQRRRALGDVGRHAPEHWLWGGPDDSIHAALLLYASSRAKLDELDARLCREAEGGWSVLRRLDTRTLQDGDGFKKHWFREHFGFRDGVAQPRLLLDQRTPDEHRRGIAQASSVDNSVRPGEFIFGYPNEYGKLPEGGGPPDLARHGSILVFRQLEQDVCGFWRFVREKARELDMNPILLASKMVGRWPNGAPLVMAPREQTAGLEQFDAFGYREADSSGNGCPFGAHVRRANPRDALVADSAESLAITKRHRLVRRGRPYGEPIFEPLDPTLFLPELDALSAEPPVSRGLHFLCFNTNVRRQFEFVQQTWINSSKFPDQHDGPDPLMAPEDGGAFDIPGYPARCRVSDMKSFVHVRGGGYFFMPGMSALGRLAAGTT